MLNLQSKYIKEKDDFEIFKDSQNRISSMSLVHEKLYQSNDFTKIDFSIYVNDLVKSLFHSYGAISNNITPNIKIDNVSLGIESAIPYGLIINELVTISLKHAFPDGRKGEIRVFLEQKGENEFELVICDNGVGISQGIDFDKSEPWACILLKYYLRTNFMEKLTLLEITVLNLKLILKELNNDL